LLLVGDTGNDCIATAIRLKCKSIVNFQYTEIPPKERNEEKNPWPEWAKIFNVMYGHQEAITKFGSDPREYSLYSKEFLGNNEGEVIGIKTIKVKWNTSEKGRIMEEIPSTERIFNGETVLLATGYTGPEKSLATQFGLQLDEKGNYKAEYGKFKTSLNKIFAAGDCRRGQSLIVWAIAEGRGAAREIDRFLMGTTQLKAPS